MKRHKGYGAASRGSNQSIQVKLAALCKMAVVSIQERVKLHRVIQQTLSTNSMTNCFHDFRDLHF